MKFSVKPAALAVASVLALAGAAQAQNVKVAFIEGLSGPFGGVGQNQLKHFQYAAERFSGKQANSGVTVEIVPMDSKGSPQEALALTTNTQPVMLTAGVAAWRAWLAAGGPMPVVVAGHSLGEYSALCAAGALDLATTARLLKLRGQAMQAAVPVGVGAMAALLGADIEKAQGLADAAAQGEVCTVANDNDPSQVVISGHRGAIERAIELVKDHGIKRGILLPVSAPFHCPLMQPAADAMAQALADASLQAPLVPVYANVAAAPVADAETIKALLVEQVTGRVRWRESVVAMFDNGVHEFVEFGGKVLAPMVKRSAQDANATSVISMDDIEALMKGL